MSKTSSPLSAAGRTAPLRVLLDTSSLMHEGAARALDAEIVPLRATMPMARIIVPMQVVAEIDKHRGSAASDRDGRRRREDAERAWELVRRHQASGAIEVFGGSEKTFADNVFQMVLVRFCERYEFCLVTQDADLAADFLAQGKRRSVHGRPVRALRIGASGRLWPWVVGATNGAPGKLSSGPVPFPASAVAATTPASAPTAAAIAALTGPARPMLRPSSGTVARLDPTPMPQAGPVAVGSIVKDAQGVAHILVERIGAGGEGTVYRTDTGLACKVYEASRWTRGMHAKLARMIACPVGISNVCWPRTFALVAGQPVGYLMPAGAGHELQRTVFVKPLLLRTFPSWNRRHLVRAALTTLRTIRDLHAAHVLLGDINPRNLLVQDENTVWFVDSDSYQIEDYPCPVGMPPFLHPDLLGMDLGTVLRATKHELFAVATLVFMLMLPGKPPYSHTGGGDPIENVRARHFPYPLGEKRQQRAPAGPWRLMWSHLPRRLKEAFHAVFTNGGTLSTDEWIQHLQAYEHGIGAGWLSDEIHPTAFRELRPEEVERHGGRTLTCSKCGKQFGTYRPDGGPAPLCRGCVPPAVDLPCLLCGTPVRIGSGLRATLEFRGQDVVPVCEQCRVTDETVVCRECGQSFVMTGRERAWFVHKSMTPPRRCPACRERRRAVREGMAAASCASEIG